MEYFVFVITQKEKKTEHQKRSIFLPTSSNIARFPFIFYEIG